MRKLGQYLLANPIHAMAAALMCSVLPLVSIPVSFLATIIVGFVTLCRGYKTGLLVLLGVAIPVFIMIVWKHTFLADLVLLRCILVWLLAGILRRTVSWRLILEVMTVLGILAVLGFYLWVGDVSVWWTGVLKYYIGLFSSITTQQVPGEKTQAMITDILPLATGLFTAGILINTFLQLLIARWWQAAVFRPGGLAKEFVEIRSGMVLAVLLTLTVIAALFSMAFAIDLLPVVILLFTIVGLSLLHKWSRYKRKIIYLLAIVYVGLVYFPTTAFFVLILALAGYVDSWYDLRKHYLSDYKKRV